MDNKIETMNDINALPTIERRVLEFYAFLTQNYSYRYTDKLRRELNISYATFTSLSRLLESKGALIKQSTYDFYCNPDIVVAVLANMALRHTDAADFLINCVDEPSYYVTDKSCIKFYECVKYSLGLLTERPIDVLSEQYLNSAAAAYRLVGFAKLISFFATEKMLHAVYMQFDTLAMDDTTLTEEILDNIHGRDCADPMAEIGINDIKRIYRYYLDGTYTTPNHPANRPYIMVLQAIYAANRGEYAEALSSFNGALKLLNRNREMKNVFFGFVASYYYIMTLVHIGTEAAVTKLNQYLKKKDIFYMYRQSLTLALATAFTSPSHAPDRDCLYRAINLETLQGPAVNVNSMGKMAAKYFGETFKEVDFKAWLADTSKYPKFNIFRHEISAYYYLDPEEREALQQVYGNQPMLTSIHRKQPWEWAIEEVVRNIDAVATPNSSVIKSKERLVYQVQGSTVVPLVQSWLKSGRWSAPKTISKKRIEEESLAGLQDCDKKFAAVVRAKNFDTFYTEWPSVQEAIPILKDSERVFYAYDYVNPVTIDEEAPYIKFNKTSSGSIAVDSNVPLDAINNIKGEYVTTAQGTNHFSVIHVTKDKQFIIKRLLAQRSFPAGSEEQVKMLLTRVEEVVEVRSPLLDSKSIPTVKGSTLVCARIAPASGMMYRVEMEVRPHEQGALYVYPGEGKAVVYEMIDGKNVRVKRDLKAETAAYKALIEDIGSLDPDNSDNGFSFMLSVDEILDLMDYSANNSDKVVVEWVEGKGLSLSHPTASSWNVGLKSTNEWFEIEGEVKVNDKSVITMSQLLELIGQSKGRYVRLNDNDYMEISSKLRRQLERLDSLATKNRNKMVISPLNAALLDDKALDGELKVAFDNKLIALRKKIEKSNNYTPDAPKTLQAQLRPYQVEGYQWMARLASWGAGACLADDMGLGKTVETIAFLLLKAAEGPALVVAPASVVPNWINELNRFAPSLTPYVLNKAADRAKLLEDAGPHDVILSTYGILNTEEEGLAKKKWCTICLDEAHIIKNKDTKMSQAVMGLTAEYRIILTGTPIQNHLGELWNLFRFINPGLLGSDESFRRKYVLPIQDGDKDKQRALQRIIKPFMLRRTKNEVVDDLPEKTEIILPVELSDNELAMYEAMRIKAANVISESDKVDVNTLAEITKLRRAACSMQLIDDKWTGPNSKIQALLDLVQDFQDGANRMLVFSQFTSFLALVRDALDKAGVKYLYLDGSTTMKERERMVKEFKDGDAPLFLISLKAGGLGLNLPEANYVVHLDPWWNPAIEQQATDRAYRIGQKRNVTVYHLVAKNTIEEKIRRLHRTKRDLADSLLEGTDMASKLGIKEILELVNV